MESHEAQNQNALTNELYEIIINNKKLRRFDLSNCTIGTTGTLNSALAAIGRAMQTGQIGLNSIFIGQNKLTEADVDVLIAGIRANRKAVKELSVNDCDLKQPQIDRFLDTFSARSPEHLNFFDISNNDPCVNSDKLDLLLRKANHLKTLRIRKCDVPIEPATLFVTRLRNLDIGGVRLSDHYISTLCSYITTPAFKNLESLSVDDCGLNGSHFQDIFQSISQSRNRNVHLNVGANPICKEIGSLPKFYYSILQSVGPSSLSLARTEWDDPSLRELLECLRTNNIIRHLDLSYIQLPTSASEETIRMLAALFERNTVIEELILAGGGTLLGDAGFGKMIVQAFPSLTSNYTLRKLDVRGNLIGDVGAFQLSEVLKENRILKCLEVDENKITMEGFKFFADAMSKNSTLTHFSKPTQDLKFQLEFLQEEITKTYQAEAELKWVLANSGGVNTRKAKADLDIQIKGRRAAEMTRACIGGVVDETMKLVERNRLIFEEVELRSRAMGNLNINTNPEPSRSRQNTMASSHSRNSWDQNLGIPNSPTLTSVSGASGGADTTSPYYDSPSAQYQNGSQYQHGSQAMPDDHRPSGMDGDIEPLSLGGSYYQSPNAL
ncbi:hypothetical protein BC938DRAFT_478611 [Jimgerdemannia flammicorona]|uniref:RNI-like protein n=1 Tax=Jimgerdemannia flammicorona TaxID=994334 RepID=A0A433QMK4_9FUNG|nr:hypothetical protein BC938DRAFT_478611 [Jimgerdemannia flammicorona]